MTSISLPAAAPAPSPFDSAPNSPTRSPPTHRRRPSRNPNAAPLPIFSFNPGADENSVKAGGMGQGHQPANTMAAEVGRRSTRLTLPEFKFNPGADLPADKTPSPTHPVLQEMVMNQQRAVRSARPAPLPAFTFNPSAQTAQASPSPTKSEFADVQLPPPRSGHRRGVSEFVGGGNSGPQLVSISPEKPEYRPHPPVSAASRGHVHRRSQAVSISDIDTSELIKANALSKARAGSTPTTPSDGALAFSYPRASPQIRQSMSNIVRTPPSSPRRRGSAPGIRPRVGFSDRVDVIPRPLSLISSETEGSNSTIRGGHSLSGSINSIASPNPQPALVVTASDMSSSPERPQTADALSTLSPGMASVNKPVSLINLPKRPLSASGSPGTLSCGSPPSKKKYFWFSQPSTGSPSSTPRVEQSDPMGVFTSEATPQPSMLRAFGDHTRPKTSSGEPGPLSSRKRKYHTWTSGIFSRRSDKRPSKVREQDIPPPPALVRRPSDRLNDIFDADDTIVIRGPSPVPTEVRASVPKLAPIQTSTTSPLAEQITSPVLDLDAALGPFGSEEKLSPGRTGPSARMAKLHSTERRGNVDAFGAVHRRTESAPIMPAVNRTTFSVHRMGSNSSLTEDVFDEEEEDNFLAGENVNSDTIRRSADNQSDPTSVEHAEIPDTDMEVTPTTSAMKPNEGLGLSLGKNSDDGVIIADLEEDVARAEARSSNSTIEAPVFQDSQAQKLSSSPMAFAYPAPQSHYASSTEGRTTSASMISSPDADHISFDAMARPGRLLGEPSPDFLLRASNDDLPSLSDSLSTGALPRFSSSAGTRSSTEQRSRSMIDPSTSRSHNQQAWKRASLASLNRLIPGSSNGSKLKFETVPDVPASDGKARRKTNRISKLMQFWRTKERPEK
ncbi:hypothetical protein PV05_02788 [Exophiala xenobiotica]|uniref:Cell wall proline rich protein n=1 Tax=Exophiala xenobiotica TaxID=348802 RepID=A0A0D2FDV6_9EURO|nr:uncharacterized protein PV05_02788 [Exophiala xenobiotica]KIW58249.1 hypothetical protein PV05_02788 [Exophiala xenobiotica]